MMIRTCFRDFILGVLLLALASALILNFHDVDLLLYLGLFIGFVAVSVVFTRLQDSAEVGIGELLLWCSIAPAACVGGMALLRWVAR